MNPHTALQRILARQKVRIYDFLPHGFRLNVVGTVIGRMDHAPDMVFLWRNIGLSPMVCPGTWFLFIWCYPMKNHCVLAPKESKVREKVNRCRWTKLGQPLWMTWKLFDGIETFWTPSITIPRARPTDGMIQSISDKYIQRTDTADLVWLSALYSWIVPK